MFYCYKQCLGKDSKYFFLKSVKICLVKSKISNRFPESAQEKCTLIIVGQLFFFLLSK